MSQRLRLWEGMWLKRLRFVKPSFDVDSWRHPRFSEDIMRLLAAFFQVITDNFGWNIINSPLTPSISLFFFRIIWRSGGYKWIQQVDACVIWLCHPVFKKSHCWWFRNPAFTRLIGRLTVIPLFTRFYISQVVIAISAITGSIPMAAARCKVRSPKSALGKKGHFGTPTSNKKV